MKKINKVRFLLQIFVWCLSLSMLCSLKVNAQEKEGCNIAIALDVSGSMVTTDENRLSVEMIQMLVDLCDTKDSVAVIAYNDYIEYQSELMEMSKAGNKEKLKEEVSQLEFKGETDNGLGLKTAMDILSQSGSDKKSYVLFISDGKTDLAASESGRTEEQSQSDWNDSCKFAQENGIQIHTISFVNEYSEDTTEMTVASAKTGGVSSVVANPLQFTKAVVQTWFAYKGLENIEIHTEDVTEELVKLKVDTAQLATDELTFMATTTEELNSFEMSVPDDEISLSKNRHYVTARITNPSKDNLYGMFSGKDKGIMLWGIIDSGKPPVEEKQIEPQKAETKSVKVKPVVKQPVKDTSQGMDKARHSRLVGLVIAGIVTVTGIICFILCRIFFGKEEPDTQGFYEMTYDRNEYQ